MDITILRLQIRKLRLRLGDLPKFPQLLSGREGCEPVCSAQALILLYNGDLLARVPWWHVGSGCICDPQGCASPWCSASLDGSFLQP